MIVTPEALQNVESRRALAQSIGEAAQARAEQGQGPYALIHALACLMETELRIQIDGAPQ